MVLAASGLLPRWPGLVHLVALPPLSLIADLGVLLVHASGISAFLAGLAASLAVRSLVLAALLGRLDRPGVLLAFRFHLAVLPPAFLAAFLLYASEAVLFYALFWFGLVATLVVFVLTAASPWHSGDHLRSGFRQAARRGFRAGTLGAYLAALTVLGVLADIGDGPVAVLLVPFSAALTLLVTRLLLGELHYVTPRRVVAAAPATGLAALLLVAELGPAGPPLAPEPEDPQPGSFMLMSGIDSASGSGAILEIDPNYMGWTCEQTFYYSYAGPGNGQPQNEALCRITNGAPYEREDTLRSRDELVPFLEEQVTARESPAVVAGHSQGVWLLWDAATSDRLPGVDTIVLVGTFLENPVSYPAAGERAPGRVGRLLLAAIEAIPRPGGGTTVFEADSPLGREWLGHPDAIEETLARPLPADLRALSVPSVYDLPLMPSGYRLAGVTNACPVPVIHPNLPYAAEFQDSVKRLLDGQPLPRCPIWRRAVGPLLRHFTVSPSR